MALLLQRRRRRWSGSTVTQIPVENIKIIIPSYPSTSHKDLRVCVCVYRPGLGISIRESRENPKSGLLQRCHVVAGRSSDLPEVNITLNSTQERDNCSLLFIWKHTEMCTWCAFVFSLHIWCVSICTVCIRTFAGIVCVVLLIRYVCVYSCTS